MFKRKENLIEQGRDFSFFCLIGTGDPDTPENRKKFSSIINVIYDNFDQYIYPYIFEDGKERRLNLTISKFIVRAAHNTVLEEGGKYKRLHAHTIVKFTCNDSRINWKIDQSKVEAELKEKMGYKPFFVPKYIKNYETYVKKYMLKDQ